MKKVVQHIMQAVTRIYYIKFEPEESEGSCTKGERVEGLFDRPVLGLVTRGGWVC